MVDDILKSPYGAIISTLAFCMYNTSVSAATDDEAVNFSNDSNQEYSQQRLTLTPDAPQAVSIDFFRSGGYYKCSTSSLSKREICTVDGTTARINIPLDNGFSIVLRAGDGDDATYNQHTPLQELTLGFDNEFSVGSLHLSAGFFDIRHPVIDDIELDVVKPISTDTSLYNAGVINQVGLRGAFERPLGDGWSWRAKMIVHQSRFTNDIPEEMFGIANQDALLKSNSISREEFQDEFDRVRQENSSDLSLVGGESLSEEGKNFLTFVAWASGVGDREINVDGIVDDLNIVITEYNNMEALEPDLAQEDIGEYVSEEVVAGMVNNLNDAISQYNIDHSEVVSGEVRETIESYVVSILQNLNGAVGDVSEIPAVVPDDIKQIIEPFMDNLQVALDDEIKANPELYYDVYRKTIKDVQELHRQYQTASNDLSTYASLEFRKQTSSSDLRFGVFLQNLQGGDSGLVTEKRFGAFYIGDQQLTNDLSSHSKLGIEYYDNYLGIDDLYNANVFYDERLRYQFTPDLMGYVGVGVGLEAIDGGIAALDFGGLYLVSDNFSIQLGYEFNRRWDAAGDTFNLDDKSGDGYIAKLQYSLAKF